MYLYEKIISFNFTEPVKPQRKIYVRIASNYRQAVVVPTKIAFSLFCFEAHAIPSPPLQLRVQDALRLYAIEPSIVSYFHTRIPHKPRVYTRRYAYLPGGSPNDILGLVRHTRCMCKSGPNQRIFAVDLDNGIANLQQTDQNAITKYKNLIITIKKRK